MVLGSIGTTSRVIEIAQLGGVGCMCEVELVFIQGFVGFVAIHNRKPCFICMLWMAFDSITTASKELNMY